MINISCQECVYRKAGNLWESLVIPYSNPGTAIMGEAVNHGRRASLLKRRSAAGNGEATRRLVANHHISLAGLTAPETLLFPRGPSESFQGGKAPCAQARSDCAARNT